MLASSPVAAVFPIVVFRARGDDTEQARDGVTQLVFA
jgi:hypothetical protein